MPIIYEGVKNGDHQPAGEVRAFSISQDNHLFFLLLVGKKKMYHSELKQF